MKHTFVALLARTVLALPLIATADTEGPYEYDLADGQAIITYFDEAYAGALSITNRLGGCPVTKLGKRAFSYRTNLTSVTIPASVTNIEEHAFFYCIGLTNVTISVGVTIIGFEAFAECHALTSITVPATVTSLGAAAFGGCTSLPSITIPASVTSIGDLTFAACTNLKRVYFAGNAPTPGYDVFRSTPATIYYRPGTTGWGPTCGGRPTAVWTDDATVPTGETVPAPPAAPQP